MKKCIQLFILVVLFIPVVISAQIQSAATGNWSEAATWVGGVVPSATTDVVIVAGHTVTLDAPKAEMKNLTIAGSLLFNKTVIVAMTVNGNILIEATGSFKVQSRTVTTSLLHTLELKGDLTNDGTGLDFRTGSSGSTLGVCNLILSGTTNSKLTVNTPSTSSNGNFNAITINKTGGAKVILGSNIFIDGGSSSEVPAQSILTFVSGIVETGNYTLVHQTGTSANIVGASSASYVYGNLGRGMANSAGSTKTFDVGDAKNYRPITVRSTTGGSATGHYLAVGVVSGNANTGSSKFTGSIDKVSGVRYYKLTYNKGAGAATMNFDKFTPSYGTDDGVKAGNVNLRVAYSLDERANWIGLNQSVNHVTDLTTPLTVITPDSIATPFTLADGKSCYVALARVSGTTENSLNGGTDVEKEETLPSNYTLAQNYPNPFNPSTVISYQLSAGGMVSLKVYDVLGNEVSTLVNEFQQAGTHNAQFSITNSQLSSGIYFYKLQANGFVSTKKMILIK